MTTSLGNNEREIVKSFERVTKSFSSSAQLIYQLENDNAMDVGFQTSDVVNQSSSAHVSITQSEMHVLDDLIQGSESLTKIVNTCAYVLRLAGRRHPVISKTHHMKSIQERCNINPITAPEFDDALKVLIHHIKKIWT